MHNANTGYVSSTLSSLVLFYCTSASHPHICRAQIINEGVGESSLTSVLSPVVEGRI
jgi:hypothetical protein